MHYMTANENICSIDLRFAQWSILQFLTGPFAFVRAVARMSVAAFSTGTSLIFNTFIIEYNFFFEFPLYSEYDIVPCVLSYKAGVFAHKIPSLQA